MQPILHAISLLHSLHALVLIFQIQHALLAFISRLMLQPPHEDAQILPITQPLILSAQFQLKLLTFCVQPPHEPQLLICGVLLQHGHVLQLQFFFSQLQHELLASTFQRVLLPPNGYALVLLRDEFFPPLI